MLRFSEVIWDICWPRLNRLNSCCHAILTSSTAPTQYQIAQTTWSTSIKPIKQIQPFRTSLLHGHDPFFFFSTSNTRISSSVSTIFPLFLHRFSPAAMAVHLDAAMDGYVGVVISMPTVAMLMGSAAVFVCPDATELRMACGGFPKHNWFNNCFCSVFGISKVRLGSVFSGDSNTEMVEFWVAADPIGVGSWHFFPCGIQVPSTRQGASRLSDVLCRRMPWPTLGRQWNLSVN